MSPDEYRLAIKAVVEGADSPDAWDAFQYFVFHAKDDEKRLCPMYVPAWDQIAQGYDKPTAVKMLAEVFDDPAKMTEDHKDWFSADMVPKMASLMNQLDKSDPQVKKDLTDAFTSRIKESMEMWHLLTGAHAAVLCAPEDGDGSLPEGFTPIIASDGKVAAKAAMHDDIYPEFMKRVAERRRAQKNQQ